MWWEENGSQLDWPEKQRNDDEVTKSTRNEDESIQDGKNEMVWTRLWFELQPVDRSMIQKCRIQNIEPFFVNVHGGEDKLLPAS